MSKPARSKNLKFIQGRVVSDKMAKTRVILTETHEIHPVLRKTIRHTKRVKIHDEKNLSKEGDLVTAIETRPLSADKRHRLFKILEKSS